MANLNQLLSKMPLTEQGEKQTSQLIISAGVSNLAISDRAKPQMLFHTSDHKQWAELQGCKEICPHFTHTVTNETVEGDN